jgi:hypothetical protein
MFKLAEAKLDTHDFANGYPTKETVEKLYDERDLREYAMPPKPSSYDPLINPAPDPVFAGIGNFRRAIGCGHAIAVRSTRFWREMDSNLRYAGTVHPVSAAVVPLGCLGRSTSRRRP